MADHYRGINSEERHRGDGGKVRAHVAFCVVLLVAVAGLVVGCVALQKARSDGANGGGGGSGGSGGSVVVSGGASRVFVETQLPGSLIGDAGGVISIVGSDGLQFFAMLDANVGSLSGVHCTDTACTADKMETTTLVPKTPFVGGPGMLRIHLGGDGNPVIVFGLTNFCLVICKTPNCSDFTYTQTTENVVENTVVAWTNTATGFPVMAGWELNDVRKPATLVTVTCGDAACSTTTRNAFAQATGMISWPPNVAVGPDGLATLAWTGQYQDGMQRKLTLARCTDAACSSLTTPVAIAGTANVTLPAVTHVAGGGIVIGFFQESDTDLGLLHVVGCPTPSCSHPSAPMTVHTDGGSELQVLSTRGGQPTFLTARLSDRAIQVVSCHSGATTARVRGADVSSPCESPTIVANANPGIIAPAPLCTPGTCLSASLAPNGLPVAVMAGFGSGWAARCSNEYCVPYLLSSQL